MVFRRVKVGEAQRFLNWATVYVCGLEGPLAGDALVGKPAVIGRGSLTASMDRLALDLIDGRKLFCGAAVLFWFGLVSGPASVGKLVCIFSHLYIPPL